ncbi:MAG: porphobilinogen synthase [Candidatus Omnitrophica bacterium]|nr:porphobilinogen synthase [Candidatus Omnitrophota bacterium]MBU1923033.1 porphobilinogen synthase [Candidatus Omnitrophota bacterium]
MERKFMAISLNRFIYPYFVTSTKVAKAEIQSFPGVYRFSINGLLNDIKKINALGLNKVLLFGVLDYKHNSGISAYKKDNIVAKAIEEIKAKFPSLVVFADVCLCAYTKHGHCAILKSGTREIDKKATLAALSKIALAYAQAGADWIAPSAMANGQVLAIRSALDRGNFRKTKILGYSAKFNSNFYGPFRNAANSAPEFGDRSGYQLDYSNRQIALKKIKEDIASGVDMVMVKPALSYLDVIKEAKQKFKFPLAAYNVSAEYALVKYGVKNKIWNEKKVIREILTSIARAGSDYIITYHAKDIAKWIKKENYSI